MLMLLASAITLVATTAGHTGCHTRACEKRVERKHMQRTVAPHRAWLYATRMCESRGNYRSRGRHRGAYQFTFDTWRRAGGKPADPADATPLRQDYTAIRWANVIGWANVRTSAGWPNCAGG